MLATLACGAEAEAEGGHTEAPLQGHSEAPLRGFRQLCWRQSTALPKAEAPAWWPADRPWPSHRLVRTDELCPQPAAVLACIGGDFEGTQRCLARGVPLLSPDGGLVLTFPSSKGSDRAVALFRSETQARAPLYVTGLLPQQLSHLSERNERDFVFERLESWLLATNVTAPRIDQQARRRAHAMVWQHSSSTN